MPRYYDTEGIVLRSIRLREADRVVHLYTRDRGFVGAVAKGVRRTRSRFGGRLEPFFRLRLVLYEGRGELHTVAQAGTVASHARLRERGASIRTAAGACESVLRLFYDGDPNAAAYNLLCRELALLDAEPGAASSANLVAFRLKLLLAAGFLPELEACVACGGSEALARFSAGAGGMVCSACASADGFELGRSAHAFMAEALGGPLHEAPTLEGAPLRQVDRVVTATLEHHAHVRLRSVA